MKTVGEVQTASKPTQKRQFWGIFDPEDVKFASNFRSAVFRQQNPLVLLYGLSLPLGLVKRRESQMCLKWFGEEPAPTLENCS
jgi:hypothetical protein